MRDRHAERTFSLRGQRGERGEGPRRGVFMREKRIKRSEDKVFVIKDEYSVIFSPMLLVEGDGKMGYHGILEVRVSEDMYQGYGAIFEAFWDITEGKIVLILSAEALKRLGWAVKFLKEVFHYTIHYIYDSRELIYPEDFMDVDPSEIDTILTLKIPKEVKDD